MTSHERVELGFDLVPLDDVDGERSGWVGWAAAPDGRWWPWWWSPAGNDAEQGSRSTPHEQGGRYPLPGLDLCGEPTATGRPCRRWVGCTGPCWQHRRIALQRRTDDRSNR